MAIPSKMFTPTSWGTMSFFHRLQQQSGSTRTVPQAICIAVLGCLLEDHDRHFTDPADVARLFRLFEDWGFWTECPDGHVLAAVGDDAASTADAAPDPVHTPQPAVLHLSRAEEDLYVALFRYVAHGCTLLRSEAQNVLVELLLLRGTRSFTQEQLTDVLEGFEHRHELDLCSHGGQDVYHLRPPAQRIAERTVIPPEVLAHFEELANRRAHRGATHEELDRRLTQVEAAVRNIPHLGESERARLQALGDAGEERTEQ